MRAQLLPSLPARDPDGTAGRYIDQPPWLPAQPPRTTAERAREIILKHLAATPATGIALLAIRRREEGDFIGYCGLIVGRCTLEEPETAYELFQRAHGRGYATEAASAVVDAAIATGRSRLWSTAWNTPSLRVLEKLGFHRDHVSAGDRGEIVWLTRSLP